MCAQISSGIELLLFNRKLEEELGFYPNVLWRCLLCGTLDGLETLMWKQWLPSKELLQGTIEHASPSLTAGMEAKSLILSSSSIPLAHEIALQLYVVLTRLQPFLLQSQPLYPFILREYCNEFYHPIMLCPYFINYDKKNSCSAVRPKILKSAPYRTLYLFQHNPLSHHINVGINQTSFISSDTWTQACNNQPSHFTHIHFFLTLLSI